MGDRKYFCYENSIWGGQEILLLREQRNRTGLGSERELRDLSQRRYTKEEITGSDAAGRGTELCEEDKKSDWKAVVAGPT